MAFTPGPVAPVNPNLAVLEALKKKKKGLPKEPPSLRGLQMAMGPKPAPPGMP